jgi:hypothetical protein
MLNINVVVAFFMGSIKRVILMGLIQDSDNILGANSIGQIKYHSHFHYCIESDKELYKSVMRFIEFAVRYEVFV